MKSEGHEDTLHKLERISDKIERVASAIFVSPCVFILVAWVFVFTVCVAGRSIFMVSWAFLEEFTGYWLVLVVSFSLSYTMWKRRHINIDIVVRLLGQRTRNILSVITSFLALVVICYLTSRGVVWFQYTLAQEVRSITPQNTLLWPFYLLIPIGFAGLGLGLLLELCRNVMHLAQSGKAEPKGERR